MGCWYSSGKTFPNKSWQSLMFSSQFYNNNVELCKYLRILRNCSVKSSHQEITAMLNGVSDIKPGNSQQQCHLMICWSDGWLGGRMVPWLGGGTVGWARRWYVLLRARMFQWTTSYTCRRFPGTHGGVLNAHTEAF